MGQTKRTTASTAGTMTLVKAVDYHAALLKEIPKAKKRIVLAAMMLVWGNRTAPIFAALKDAVTRGVSVSVLLDNYTRLGARYNLQPRPSRTRRIRRTFETLEELSSLGATIYCFGKIGLTPYKGRCHVKASVIDDTYYSFGGINLYDQCFEQTDYMLKGSDAAVADLLDHLIAHIGTTPPPLSNSETVLNAASTLLFDGGRPGHSLIYERACELASQAKQIYFVSNFTPSGPLAKFINETNAACYFNRPEQMIAPDAWGQAFDQQRYHIANAHTGSNLLHAKCMLFELASGKRIVLSGSHNFSYRGVAFGVQEIAVQSTDSRLWQQVYDFITHEVITGNLGRK